MNKIKLAIITISIIGCSAKVKAQIQTETVKDIDGNEYKTVLIGNQLWMAENLRTTKFKNGKPIPKNSDPKSWKTMMGGGYCIYENNIKNAKAYGFLYNWHAVRAQKICPVDWHVPSDGEWDTLALFLGGTKIGATHREEVEILEIGAKLKEKDTINWDAPNTNASNESGFNGLPGGYVTSGGAFDFLKQKGYWWSASISNTYGAFCRFLNNDNASLNKINLSKTYGFSVRCIKN